MKASSGAEENLRARGEIISKKKLARRKWLSHKIVVSRSASNAKYSASNAKYSASNAVSKKIAKQLASKFFFANQLETLEVS
jgi:hypothetical protein